MRSRSCAWLLRQLFLQCPNECVRVGVEIPVVELRDHVGIQAPSEVCWGVRLYCRWPACLEVKIEMIEEFEV